MILTMTSGYLFRGKRRAFPDSLRRVPPLTPEVSTYLTVLGLKTGWSWGGSTYLTVLGLKTGWSWGSEGSTCSASSSSREMTSRAALCSGEEQTGVFTSCRSTRYLLSTWHSLASREVHWREEEEEEED